MDNVLPCKIGGLSIKKLEWSDFKGTPNYDLKWMAHAFWGIGYNYEVTQKQASNKKVAYVIDPIEIKVWLKRKSWTKKISSHLLNHEQGHYIIGCLCALEFKKQATSAKFSDNYRLEIPRLFEKILRDHILMEKKYDKETNHRLNRPLQIIWDNSLLTKINYYK